MERPSWLVQKYELICENSFQLYLNFGGAFKGVIINDFSGADEYLRAKVRPLVVE